MKPSAILWFTLCLPFPAFAAPAKTASGNWKFDGIVQDTPIRLTCMLTEEDHKLTGTCATASNTKLPVTGETGEKGIGFRFDSVYQGSPITVSMHGSLDPEGNTISGTISVDPLGGEGTFTASRLPNPAGTPAIPGSTSSEPAAAPASAPAPAAH